MGTNKSLEAFDKAVSIIRKELETNPYPWDETVGKVRGQMFLDGLEMDAHMLTMLIMDYVIIYHTANNKEIQE